MARIPHVDHEALPPDRRALLDTLAERDGHPATSGFPSGSLNIYRTLGNHPDLLEAFREYGTVLWNEGGLDATERELVILTTAHAAGSAYEWHQHVRVALDEGMDAETIRAVSAGETDGLDPRHAALVEYVRNCVEGTVGEAIHDRIADHHEPDTLVGITLLSGLYLGLARALDAFDVETEIPFVGWELEHL
jgi:alkylhydroperoxidase family enzyme